MQNDIRSLLMKAGKPAFAPDTFVDFAHARRLILALGGLPSYPMLADGTAPLTGYEADLDALVADLRARGVLGVELIPPRNSPEACCALFRLCARRACLSRRARSTTHWT